MDKDDNKPKPKSKLSEDVIYGIAEQMFFEKPFSNKGLGEIDLTKQNPYTIFMGHCQVHLNAMMAQFAKLKRIEFSKFFGKDSITFYKHKDFGFANRDGKDAFSGPYRVTKKMAFGVIEYGKLRVSAVKTTNYLKKLEKTVSTNDDVYAAQKKPIEVFAALFLDQTMSEEEIAKNCELNIEHLCVYEPPEVIEANLLSLLALNSVEIELNSGDILSNTYSESIFFGSLHPSLEIIPIANKTQKITVNFGFSLDTPIEDFASFGLKWQRQANFLANFCPNLEQLHFKLDIYFTDGFLSKQIMQQIRAVVNTIQMLLEQMDDGGGNNEKLRVCVEFTSTCAEPGSVEALTALDNSANDEEQIFKLGSPFPIDIYDQDDSSPYIARSIEIRDPTGRPHQCKFKVFEETPPSPNSSNFSQSVYYDLDAPDYGYDDFDDDYNYGGGDFDDDDGDEHYNEYNDLDY